MMEIKDFRADLEIKADGEEGQIFGIAAGIGNKDHMDDIIEPGAFKRTIDARDLDKRPFPILNQHQRDAGIGATTAIEEIKKGLRVAGQLVMDIQLARDVFALIKAKVVTGLSIGFRIPKGGAEWDQDSGVRRIKEINLLEWSPVTFPANEQARLTGTKGIEGAYAELVGNKIIIDLGRLDSRATHEGALGKTDPPDGDDSADGYSLRLASDIREAVKGHGHARH